MVRKWDSKKNLKNSFFEIFFETVGLCGISYQFSMDYDGLSMKYCLNPSMISLKIHWKLSEMSQSSTASKNIFLNEPFRNILEYHFRTIDTTSDKFIDPYDKFKASCQSKSGCRIHYTFDSKPMVSEHTILYSITCWCFSWEHTGNREHNSPSGKNLSKTFVAKVF